MKWVGNKMIFSEEEKEEIDNLIRSFKPSFIPDLDKLKQYNLTEIYNKVYDTNYSNVIFFTVVGTNYDFIYSFPGTFYDNDSNSLLCFFELI